MPASESDAYRPDPSYVPARVSSEILDRLPPNNADAERGIIGSVLLDPLCLGPASDVVRAEDFYAPMNAAVFGAILALDRQRRPIDLTTLREHLAGRRDIDCDTLAAHLAECIQVVPHAANAVYYAQIVREKALLRGVIQASTDTLRDAYYPDDAPQVILDRAEQRLQQIGGCRSAETKTAAQLAIEVGDFVDAVVERGSHLGLPTGLADFDERIGGLFGGELIILAARPSVGKSSLASQIADYLASSGRLVYFASLEMTGRELAMRSVCAAAQVNSRAIRTNRLTAEDRERLVEGLAQYGQRKLIVDARPDVTVEALARTVRRLLGDGLQLAVVDYLGLMTPSDPKQRRYEQVSYQTRALKLLARETGIPLLVLCQLNRATMENEGPPQLHHLRESGSIEQDADVVMFIHRPEDGIMLPDPENKRQKIKADWPAELIVAKQRNGATGRIKLDWTPEYTRFSCWGTSQLAYQEFAEFS